MSNMITQVPGQEYRGGHDPAKSAEKVPMPVSTPMSMQAQVQTQEQAPTIENVQNMTQIQSNTTQHPDPNQGSKPTPIPFFGDDPNVLLMHLEFFPTEAMTYAQKLNAIARSVLVLTLVICIWTGQWARTALVTTLTISAIYVMYMHRSGRTKDPAEGFATPTSGPVVDAMIAYGTKGHDLPPTTETIFQEPSSTNPFSNVMVPDYELNPHKLPAPPVDRPEVSNQILQQAVNLVQEANPSQPGITDKLFRDVNDQLNFEQSMRPFMSNPATTIPNDQGAFAQFCYGSMVSCKEGNLFACARNTSHYTNY